MESYLYSRSFHTALRGGSGAPGLITADDGCKYVVKWSADGMRSAAVEWLGLHLAQSCGFRVPRPGIVHVDQELVDSIKDPEIREIAAASIGPNPALQFLPAARALTCKDVAEFVPHLDPRLFAFDILLLNVDRRLNNPNLLFDGADLYLIDFNAALQIQSILRQQDYDIESIAPSLRMHPCYSASPPPEIIWSDAERQALADCVAQMPDQWLISDLSRAQLTAAIDELFTNSGFYIQRRQAVITTRAFSDLGTLRDRARANRDRFEAQMGKL